MGLPLISVVIPTFARPHFLERSIRSALHSAPEGDLEIIVVPNGPDQSWKTIACEFAKRPEISWHPITESNACVARNHGMNVAQGKYIRFLDDDDYLFENAYLQLQLLDEEGADVSQAGINWINANSEILRTQNAQSADDFLSSVLQPDFFTLLHSFIWLLEKRKRYPWNVLLKIGDDVEFALSPILHEDLRKTSFALPVGAWVHHGGLRLSTDADDLSVSKDLANILLNMAASLKKNGRLTFERRESIVARLWQLIHTQFPLAPIYWSYIARNTLEILPGSHPEDRRFLEFPLRFMHPLMVEWAFFPYRRLRRILK